jgi:hypothetical protein
MPVPALISDLSTTAASNSPPGSEAVFPNLDNYLRALSSFIAQNYANKAALASPTFTGTVTAATIVYTGALSGPSPAFTGTTTAVDLTTTGNTVLGNAATDTLNVGAGGIVKDASGNVTLGGNLTVTGNVTSVVDVTTTGNTILGNASTDTLNVGNGGLIKDSSGRVGIGATPALGSSVLEVTHATDGRLVLHASTATASSGSALLLYRNSTYLGRVGISANQLADGTTDWLQQSVGAMRFATGAGTGTEWLKISTAGDITGLGVAITRSKSATTSRNSTTTFADDPHLVVPLSVGTWAVDGYISAWATTSGAGGFKSTLAFSGTSTSASTIAFGQLNSTFASASAATLGINYITAATLRTGTGVAPADWLRYTGTITVSVAGNLSLQWAQEASNANNTNVGIGSYLSCTKVA